MLDRQRMLKPIRGLLLWSLCLSAVVCLLLEVLSGTGTGGLLFPLFPICLLVLIPVWKLGGSIGEQVLNTLASASLFATVACAGIWIMHFTVHPLVPGSHQLRCGPEGVAIKSHTQIPDPFSAPVSVPAWQYGACGFALSRETQSSIDTKSRIQYVWNYQDRLLIPHWFIVSAGMVLPLMRVRAYRRQREKLWRQAHGLCIACGYDLRASQSRCPECGMPITTTKREARQDLAAKQGRS